MRPSLPSLTAMRVHTFMRIVLLALSIGVALGTSAEDTLPYAGLLLVSGLVASRPWERHWVLATTSLEGLLVGVAVARTGWADSPFLPYLIAPAFTGGLAAGLLGAVLPVGAAAAVLVAVTLSEPGSPVDRELSSDLAQWVVLAIVVAAVASWVRAVLLEAEQALPDVRAAQLEAFRLLTELRNVARQLPGTLDPATAAESMLQRARETARVDVGAVLVPSGGASERLNVVATIGSARRSWDFVRDPTGPLAEAWRSRRATVLSSPPSANGEPARGGSGCVLPLLSGNDALGLVLLESHANDAFPPQTVLALQECVEELALQLHTGLVFEEVRELATAEERRRLSREIHDGIAQELASVAYALDTASADLEPDHAASPQVQRIRDEVRRLLNELRMSLFDLRSEVGPDEGLGAAIGRHVRAVGAAAGLTVHLSLNESPVRLPAETEAELLRIVQEAVANARRHAQAGNLWVSCTVDPPMAAVIVEDDGRGFDGSSKEGSHGLAVMRERAARIRGQLLVQRRAPRGTRVSVTVGKVRS